MVSHDRTNNVLLCGTVSQKPCYSHSCNTRRYYVFHLTVDRLSGTEDRLKIICDEALLESLELTDGTGLKVKGELRSFNNKSGVGSKLQIFVYAFELCFCDEGPQNEIFISGTVCKKPSLRVTPLGREICDLLLAVNRSYGHSDYLPCITWGRCAKKAALLEVGDRIGLEGRIQSRTYIKTINGMEEEKTAYEVSASTIYDI